MKNNFLYEDIKDAIATLKQLGRTKTPKTITNKDLKDLGDAKASWSLTPEEAVQVHKNTVEQGLIDKTNPGRPSKMEPRLDTYEPDDYTAFTDTNIERGGTSTSVVTALQQNQDLLADTIAIALSGQLAKGVDEADLRDEIMQAIKGALTREIK